MYILYFIGLLIILVTSQKPPGYLISGCDPHVENQLRNGFVKCQIDLSMIKIFKFYLIYAHIRY